MRRYFIECAAGQVRLTDWRQGWIERIALLYRLNEARLEHYDPGLERQTPAFDAAQGTLKEALDGLFAQAEQEFAGLSDQAREGKALRSLLNHREGLCVFVDRPQVPLDTDVVEQPKVALVSVFCGGGRSRLPVLRHFGVGGFSVADQFQLPMTDLLDPVVPPGSGFSIGSIRESYVFAIECLERQEVGLWTSKVSRCGFRRRAG